jgi:hypothetical protein
MAAAAQHGIPGTTCKECTKCQICDCECKTCTHARRKAAGLVCLDCNKDCGFAQCDDCYEREEDEKARAEDEPPVCYDCKQEWCDGGPWCPANGPETVNPLEAAYGMVDDEDLEMHYMMEEQREEEDRRFRAQMARHAAAKRPAAAAATTSGK